MIRGFRGAVGTTGAVFAVLAALAWLALPFGHPVYAVLIPPLIGAGIVLAAIRLRRVPRHPSIREDGSALGSPRAPIEPK
jgi:hypothetical protein